MTDIDPNESTSLADHESTYVHQESAPATELEPTPVPEPAAGSEPDPVDAAADPAGDRGERDEQGRFTKPKYRNKNQVATAADVPRIQALTKRLREAEDRAKAAEEKLNAPPQPRAIPEAPKAFDAAEPKYEDFANEPDQYAAWMRAVAAYDRKKDGYEQQKSAHDTAREADIKARNAQRDQWFKTHMDAHHARMDKLFASDPTAQQTIDTADIGLTPIMVAALISSDQSDQLALRLAQDRDLVDDLVVLTDGKAPTSELVALVQRRMTRGLQVAPTGSTAPAPVVTAPPRPPNPVRTGVMKPADAPPGEDSSLSEHERAYGSGGRRRR